LGLLGGQYIIPFSLSILPRRLEQLGMVESAPSVQNEFSILLIAGIHVFATVVASVFTVPLQQYAVLSYIYILKLSGQTVVVGISCDAKFSYSRFTAGVRKKTTVIINTNRPKRPVKIRVSLFIYFDHAKLLETMKMFL
jgi:hypothetical protein